MAIQFNFQTPILNALYQRRQEQQRQEYMTQQQNNRDRVYRYNEMRDEEISTQRTNFNKAMLLLMNNKKIKED